MKKILLKFIVILMFPAILCSGPIKPRIVDSEVLFQYDAPNAKTVFLPGSFNGWDPTKTKMERDGSKGTFQVRLTLKPGEYEYKYYVDGNWLPEENQKLKLKFDDDGNLVLDKPDPISNTPLNSKVFVSGKYYNLSRYQDVNSDSTTKWKFLSPWQALTLNLKYKINDDVYAITEFLAIGDAIDAFKPYRLFVNAKMMGFHGIVFRNDYVYYPEEPMHLLDPYIYTLDSSQFFTLQPRNKINKFGRDKQGIYFNYNSKFGRINILYDNDINTNIDDVFFRYTNTFNSLTFGINYFIKRDYPQAVPEPQFNADLWAEFPKGSGKWYHFDTFPNILIDQEPKQDNYSFDLRFDKSGFTAFSGLHYYEDRKPVFYAHTDIDNQGSSGNRDIDLSLYTSSKVGYKVKAGFWGKISQKNQVEISFMMQNETIDEFDKDMLVKQNIIVLRKINPQLLNFNLKQKFSLSFMNGFLSVNYKQCKDIENYDYRIPIFYFNNDYFLNQLYRINTNKVITIRPEINTNPMQGLKTSIVDNYKLFIGDELNNASAHYYNELILINKYSFNSRVHLNTDIRFMMYNFGDNYKHTFIDLFFELRYQFTRNIYFSAGYGVDPEINDDYSIGRYFMLNDLTDNDKINYMDKLMEAERLLNNNQCVFLKVQAEF